MERTDHGKIVDTIDTLVFKINAGQFDESNATIGEEMLKRMRLRHERIQAAKLAVNAMFQFKEAAALHGGLKRYREFLFDLFPDASRHWFDTTSETNNRVLTFNYDRLFELAFHDRFNVDTQQWGFYGQKVLNSGLDHAYYNNIEFAPDRFCLLKLHGSIGMWVGDDYGEPRHAYQFPAPLSTFEATDDFYFAEPATGSEPFRLKSTPLQIFPHERQFIRGNKSGFLFHRYVENVWKYAEELVARAREIVIIGYSFAGIDRQPFLELLSQAKDCETICVRNPDAKDICAKVLRNHSEWSGIIRADDTGF